MLEVHVYTLYSGSLALFSIVPQFPHASRSADPQHGLPACPSKQSPSVLLFTCSALRLSKERPPTWVPACDIRTGGRQISPVFLSDLGQVTSTFFSSVN